MLVLATSGHRIILVVQREVADQLGISIGQKDLESSWNDWGTRMMMRVEILFQIEVLAKISLTWSALIIQLWKNRMQIC